MIHGHKLFLNFLNQETKLEGKTLVEIGSVREFDIHQNSTYEFAKFCQKHEMKFYTVDMDPECTNNAKEIFKKLSYQDGVAINQKGEDFLRDFDGKIHYLYLDAFDFYHSNHSEKRKQKYHQYLGCKIEDNLCHQMHLDACQNAIDKLTNDAIICFDDILDPKTFKGKGKLAIPFLLSNGWQITKYQPNAMILTRNNPQ